MSNIFKRYEREEIEGKQILKSLGHEINILKSLNDQNMIKLLDILKQKKKIIFI